MNLGEAYYNTSHGHHCFVVSHPDPETGEVVVVNTTTWTADKDHACIIEASEHPNLSTKSVIAYNFAVALNMNQQAAAKAKYQPCTPLSSELLDRIQIGLDESEYAPKKCVKLVRASAKRQREEKRAAAAQAVAKTEEVLHEQSQDQEG